MARLRRDGGGRVRDPLLRRDQRLLRRRRDLGVAQLHPAGDGPRCRLGNTRTPRRLGRSRRQLRSARTCCCGRPAREPHCALTRHGPATPSPTSPKPSSARIVRRSPPARRRSGAVDGLRERFLGAPHRPNGPDRADGGTGVARRRARLAAVVSGPQRDSPSLELCREENAEAVAATVAALRASAATLTGGDERPDFQRIEVAPGRRGTSARSTNRELPPAPWTTRVWIGARAALPNPGDLVFGSAGCRLRAAGSGIAAPELDELDVAGRDRAARRAARRATKQIAVEHTGIGSVWLRNSVRGAAGLTVAVFIAQRSGLQHSFWVVLGTLSVLRSNALSTGWSIVSALAGTAVGIVLGALLDPAIGTNEYVLWAVLPFAVLLAAYAPRAISFAAGQAGFTVVLFVLFNLIQPIGWTVGLVRIEDVAIGFAISLGVGLLFWPRGAATVLRDSLASAYGRSADYVVATARQIDLRRADERVSRSARQVRSRSPPPARRRLSTVSRRAVRGAGRSGKCRGARCRAPAAFAEPRSLFQRSAAWWTATPGSRAAARTSTEKFMRCGRGTSRSAIPSFTRTVVPPPHIRDTEGRRRLLDCVRTAVAGGDETKVPSALVLLWANQHLDNLWRLESHLGRSAVEASSGGSRP